MPIPTMPARSLFAFESIGEFSSLDKLRQQRYNRLLHAKSELTLAMQTPAVKPAEPADSSRVDAVYEQILLRIVRGELSGGTELKSTKIAEQLGISRTPVVQALQRLASDGIVTLEMNKRAVVRPGAEKWLVELHELRELLEPAAAARAVERITEDDLARLDALAAAAEPHSHAGWEAAAQQFDFAIHLAIADRAGNFALAET